MKTIQIHASRAYPVHVGKGLLGKLGDYVLQAVKPTKAVIISDSNVWPLYGKQALASLQAAGLTDVSTFVFPAGEQSKCGAVYLQILDQLAHAQLTRSDCIIALGGGVVGDITGFAAATYLRGIAYIQVPTTLLAAVDSSVGGKTAIDLPSGKNLAGAFYQPSLVLCDIDTLNTLPKADLQNGCAEVIKYALLFDAALFAHLDAKGLDFDREQVICRCVELKRDVVLADEYDRGLRQKLNLGHTVGHGIEAHSGYTVPHGQAVAIGMAIVANAAQKQGFCPKEVWERTVQLLQKFGLPTETDCDAATLYQHTLSDKKRAGDTIALILPRAIGQCDIVPTVISQLQSFIEAGVS